MTNILVSPNNVLNILKKENLYCSWNTIQIGWNLKLLSVNEIHKFALDFSEDNPNLINEDISEIIFLTDENKVEKILKKIINSLNIKLKTSHTNLWKKEWKKWRYCVLKNISDHIKDEERLLTKVEGVYADFNYPEDMKPFIYYLPADEKVADLKPQEARKILIKRLKVFLAKEKKELINN